MATDNYYFERNDHDTSIDSLPSILSERPSHNTLQDLINYNISPKLFNGSDLTYGIEKSVHESREFVRKSANRNFKPPQIDRNSMLSPGRKEYVVEINDQNAFLQPDSKKFMNKKIIKGIKSSKITGNLAPEVTTKISQQKPKTPNKTSIQKSKTGFQPTNWTSPNMKKLPPNPSSYTIMENSQAPPEKLNRKSLKSRNTPIPETIYESNLYPSTSTLGEDKPEPEVVENNPSIVDGFTEEEESQDHPIPENDKPPSPSESMIYKRPKRYDSGFDQAAHKEKLNLSINLEEEEEEEGAVGVGVGGKNIIPQVNNKPQIALGNKEKLVRPFLGVLEQKLITDDSMMDPPTTPNRTRVLRDYSSFIHGESSLDILGTNRESNIGANAKLDNTVYLSPRSDGGNFFPPQENRLPSSPQSSNDDTSFVSCLSYDPNFPTDLVQNNSFKKIEVQVSKETPNDKDFIKNLLHNIEKENKNPPKNTKTEYRYAATTKAKDQPYLTQLNSQTFKKSLDINKNREAMLKNSYKILKDLDTVWFHSEAERDEIIYKAQPQTTKQAKQAKIPPLRQKPGFNDEQEFRHPCSPKISPKEKSKKFEPPAAAVYTERSLTDIVLSNDFQPKIVKNVNLSISALKVNESSQDMSREYANKTDFSLSQSNIPCENDEYFYESVDAKVKGLNAQPPHMGKKSHPQKVLDVIEKAENLAQKTPETWQPESADMFDVYESFSSENDNSVPNNDEIAEPNHMRYRVTLMDQSQLPIIDEVSSTHVLTASYVDNQPSLAQKNNLTNISIHSDYCLTEPDPNFSRILTELPQDLICGGSLDNLDLLCYENVQNSSDSNRIISDSIREMNNYSTDEKQKTIGNLLEGLKPELSSLNMNLIKTKSSGTTPQASSQRRKVKKSKYDENNKKRNGSNSDFILQTQKEKNLPKKIEKEKKFSEMGYDNISREVLIQTQENCLISRLDKNTELGANGINTMKTSKQTQSISITSSKAPLKMPKSTNSLTAIPIAKKKLLNDKENQEKRDATRTFLRRPDLTKEPLQAKILNSYTKTSTDLGYKDENLLLSSRNSSLSEIDPLVSNEVLKGQAMCYAGLLNNYNFLDNDKIDVSRKHQK